MLRTLPQVRLRARLREAALLYLTSWLPSSAAEMLIQVDVTDIRLQSPEFAFDRVSGHNDFESVEVDARLQELMNRVKRFD